MQAVCCRVFRTGITAVPPSRTIPPWYRANRCSPRSSGPTGCQTVYQHNTVPLLTGVIDPNGYATSYTYDGSNRAITRVVAGLGTTTFAYGTNQMSVRNILGRVLTHFARQWWRDHSDKERTRADSNLPDEQRL